MSLIRVLHVFCMRVFQFWDLGQRQSNGAAPRHFVAFRIWAREIGQEARGTRPERVPRGTGEAARDKLPISLEPSKNP